MSAIRPRPALLRVPPSRLVLLLTSVIVVAAGRAHAQSTGITTGRSGKWPLLQPPLGNPFESDPQNEYRPLAGSRTERKARLGKALFWDEQLSSDNTMACATCHLPEVAGVDPRATLPNSLGGQGSAGVMRQDALENFVASTSPTQREATPFIAPTVLGAAFAGRVLWQRNAGPAFKYEDGTEILLDGVDQFADLAALEAQAVLPPINATEMAHVGLMSWGTQEIKNKLDPARVLALATLATVPADLLEWVDGGLTYAEVFDLVFADDPLFSGKAGVTRERFALAIASYERTLIPNQAPIDTGPLSPAAAAGHAILQQSSCLGCHGAFEALQHPLTGTGGFVDAADALLTDNLTHGGLGFPSAPGAVPNTPAHGAFPVKTPTLRNVTLHRRWGHNGFFESFDGPTGLLAFYNRQHPAGTPLIPLRTTTGGILGELDMGRVRAFFAALVDPRLIPSTPGGPLPPPFDHPDLHSHRVPFESNEPAAHAGTPAVSGGTVPDVIAHVPLLHQDANHKIGLRNAPGLTLAGLWVSPNPLPQPALPGPIRLNLSGLQTVTLTTNSDGFATWAAGFLGLAPGMVFSAQWVVFDPASGGLAYSNAAELTVQ